MTAPHSLPPSEPEPQRETHLLEYVEVLKNRKALILAIFLGVTGIATVRSLLTRPAYRGTTQILIEPENQNPINVGDISDPIKSRDDYYQTQYSPLRKPSIARRVEL